MANRTLNFLPADSNWKLEPVKILESLAIEMGTAISTEISSNTTTGKNTKAGVENASGKDFVGILAKEVATTDADYATVGKKKSVWIPLTKRAKAYFTVGAGTFTAADVGKTVEIHSDSKTLAVDTPGKGAKITDYISATRGKCIFDLPLTETA